MFSKQSVKTLAKPFRTRLRLFGLLLLLFTLCVPQLASARNRESISVEWKSPVNQPVSLAMSVGGSYFGSIDRDGTVRFYSREGRLLWKELVEDATDMMIASKGEISLVFSRNNSARREVQFLQKNGRRLWSHQVEGAILCAALAQDGSQAVVTTTEGRIYAYRFDGRGPTWRRWRLDGNGYCVTFSPNKRIVVGTTRSQLVCYDIVGKLHWRTSCDADKQYDLCISSDGRRLLGLISGTQQNPSTEVNLWDSAGKHLWTRTLNGFDARALVSPNSQYVAVSYASFLVREGGMTERKVAVYSANGQLSWEKGGLFFGPQLVALSPTGSSVIVTDGDRSLYNMDSRGRILSRHTLGGTVRQTVSSEDGRSILLYCGDGWLYLIKVG